eukprot:SAG31_NODE_6576_length_1965_cov_1.946409_2_plen_172_part_00
MDAGYTNETGKVVDKAAIKATWPETIDELASMLGDGFVVGEKTVTMVKSKSKKRKADATEGGTNVSKKSKSTKEKLPKAAHLAADKSYKWKKHCAAVLAVQPKQQMQPEALRAAVVKRVVTGKKKAEGVATFGSEKAWVNVVTKAAELRVTATALGEKFSMTKKGKIRMSS